MGNSSGTVMRAEGQGTWETGRRGLNLAWHRESWVQIMGTRPGKPSLRNSWHRPALHKCPASCPSPPCTHCSLAPGGTSEVWGLGTERPFRTWHRAGPCCPSAFLTLLCSCHCHSPRERSSRVCTEHLCGAGYCPKLWEHSMRSGPVSPHFTGATKVRKG